jgi:putative peptidoglycan lipid II flippase
MPAREPAGTAADHVLRSSLIISAAVAMSRVTGLVREILLARLFGASVAYDAFLLGFRLPNLARDLFAEGALSSAFVPTFTEYLARKGKEEAARLSNLVATATCLLLGVFCLAGVLLSSQLVSFFAPGFAQVPGKTELATGLTQIMFPFLLLVALAAQVMGVLNARNRFAVPALASTMFNVGSITMGLGLGFWAGDWLGISPIEGMAWGVVLGGALQLLWQLPSLSREGFPFRPAFDWNHPGLRHIFALMGPAILGGAAVQINVLVNTNFASEIVDPVRGANGPVSWLAYAFRFMQLPLGLFGVAIASATLPAISRSFAADNLDEFRQTLSRSLGFVFLLTVPSSIGLAVLGRAMIAAIYEGGQFDSYDTRQTAIALMCYAIGLAGYSAIKVLTPAFYTLGDSRTPMIVSFLSIAINYTAVSLLLAHTTLGHAGLALSTSFVAIFNFLVLFLLMRRRIGGVYGRDLAESTRKIGLASLAMGAALTALSRLIESHLPDSRWASIGELALCIPAGLVVFYAVCRWQRVPELELATRAFTRRFRDTGTPGEM